MATRKQVKAWIDQSEADLEASPRNDPTEVSYPYPFMIDGEYIAPIAYDGWDDYQGNSAGAQTAVRRLLAKVKAEFSNFGRAPK